jgi:hypothetical protein
VIRRIFFLFLLAGLLPLFCLAQNSQEPSPPPAQSSSATAPEKPKKVWTNDEVGSLKGTVSVVGDKAPAKTSSPADKKTENAKAGSHAAAVRKYRDQITQLKTQIGLADARISQMKNFKANNAGPGGGIDPRRGYTMLPPEEQIKQLEAKKKQLQAKIDDLELQAEKEGIDPGELR